MFNRACGAIKTKISQYLLHENKAHSKYLSEADQDAALSQCMMVSNARSDVVSHFIHLDDVTNDGLEKSSNKLVAKIMVLDLKLSPN